jgi:hypothetical protein
MASERDFYIGFVQWLKEQGYGRESGRICEALTAHVTRDRYAKAHKFHSQQIRHSWNLALGYLATTEHATDELLSARLGAKAPPV